MAALIGDGSPGPLGLGVTAVILVAVLVLLSRAAAEGNDTARLGAIVESSPRVEEPKSGKVPGGVLLIAQWSSERIDAAGTPYAWEAAVSPPAASEPALMHVRTEVEPVFLT